MFDALHPQGQDPLTSGVSLRVPSFDRVLRTGIRGCLAGVVATVVMTVYRIPVFSALPPTSEFWARYVGGGDAEQYPLAGLVLHVSYGAAAGAMYGVLVSFVEMEGRVARERTNLLAGLAYGLVLSAIGSRFVFVRILGRELQPEHALVFHVGHAIYGVTLGTFMASREPVGDVYEESQRRLAIPERRGLTRWFPIEPAIRENATDE